MSKIIFIDNIEYTPEQVLTNNELYNKHLIKLKKEKKIKEMREDKKKYFNNKYKTDKEFRSKNLLRCKNRRIEQNKQKILNGEIVRPQGRPRKDIILKEKEKVEKIKRKLLEKKRTKTKRTTI